jgi:S1-C subfamily serine protease
MELSIEVEPGDSGGPIIDAKGQVIGLIFSRSTKQDETSYGISSSEFIKVTQNYDSSAVSSGNCRD